MTLAETLLITGANRGIGLELVRQISANYAPRLLFAVCRKPQEAAELQKLALERPAIKILELKDVRDYSSFLQISAEVDKQVGEGGLNLLINNAGVSPRGQNLKEVNSEQLLETYEINAVAPLLFTKNFIPMLERASNANSSIPTSCARAAVINISSQMGSVADNTSGGFYAYRSSKAALNMITRSLSVDLNPMNILVTAIHPGWVKTDMGGPKAPMPVEECATKILETLSNLTSKHNGEFVNYASKFIPW